MKSKSYLSKSLWIHLPTTKSGWRRIWTRMRQKRRELMRCVVHYFALSRPSSKFPFQKRKAQVAGHIPPSNNGSNIGKYIATSEKRGPAGEWEGGGKKKKANGGFGDFSTW